MDEKSNQLLQEILNQQKEQTELFRRHLWRLRFSLLGLLLLMTITGIALGIGVYLTRPKSTGILLTQLTTSVGLINLKAANQPAGADDLFGPTPPPLQGMPNQK